MVLQTDVDITAKAEKRGDSVYLQQTVGVELEEGKKRKRKTTQNSARVHVGYVKACINVSC